VKGQVESKWVARALRYAIERKRAERELKASLGEKEALLKEIHHRAKDNLQIVCSLLKLQAWCIDDERALAVFKESQARIRSMALLHEKLYLSKDVARVDFGEYLRSLAADLMRAYAAESRAVMLKVAADHVLLDVDTAIPCGLIATEVVSNCLKHAFPDQRPGEISVTLRSEEDGRILLSISDNGVGFPPGVDFQRARSLGLRLVISLSHQLGGALQLCQQGGTEFKITFPPSASRASF
jgi:two-component sensor histidine kinase